jgi:hypothetical protein
MGGTLPFFPQLLGSTILVDSELMRYLAFFLAETAAFLWQNSSKIKFMTPQVLVEKPQAAAKPRIFACLKMDF